MADTRLSRELPQREALDFAFAQHLLSAVEESRSQVPVMERLATHHSGPSP